MTSAWELAVQLSVIVVSPGAAVRFSGGSGRTLALTFTAVAELTSPVTALRARALIRKEPVPRSNRADQLRSGPAVTVRRVGPAVPVDRSINAPVCANPETTMEETSRAALFAG